MQFLFALLEAWVLVGSPDLGGVPMRKYIPSNVLVHLEIMDSFN